MKLKKTNKLLSFLISATLLTGSLSANISAAPAKYRLVADLSNVRVYYSETYAAYYGERTMRAAFQWKADPRLQFYYPSRTNTSSSSQVQCRMYSQAGNSTFATTTFYYGSSGVYPDNGNWDNCIIKVNHAYDVQLPTLIHEFGHVLGLRHDTNVNSIMCPTGNGRVATVPSYNDYTLIYQKYSPYVGL